jgi:hypothetical protein
MSDRKDSVALGAALAVVAALGAGEAQAVTLVTTVDQLLQSGGGAYSGQFNVASFLSSGSQQFAVTGGRVVAYGYSNAQYNQTTSGPTSYAYQGGYSYLTGGGYSYYVQTGCYYSFWGGGGCYGYSVYVQPTYASAQTYNTYQDINHTDTVVDAMLLDVGDGTGAGTVGLQATQVGQYNYVNATQTGSYYSGYTTYNNYRRDNYGGSYGNLSTVANLSTADIANVNSSGALNFSVLASVGQFTLNSAQFEFDLVDVTPQVPNLPGVPEPATWAMLILGFGAMGCILRRRRTVAQIF